MKDRQVKARVDFSLRREVFFVVVGAIIGAVMMVVPRTFFEVEMGLPYYLTWVAFGHIVGVYSSDSIIAGIAIHMVTAISIGIIVGIFLYKSGILNISKLSNGIIYGLFTGSVVFVAFFIPVYQYVLSPNIAETMGMMDPSITQVQADILLDENFISIMVGSLINHLVFGTTLGIISSLLSIKFGARYRCSKCDISFSRINSFQKHVQLVHGEEPIEPKRVLILGGGFAGIQVLMHLQKEFQDDINVDITLVSRDNFFLFTPMLPEVSSGAIETRHIVTPVRAFCNRARFYEANIDSISLDKKEVVITHAIGKNTEPLDWRTHILKYDYLVIALGNETNFFGMDDVAKNAFTIKSLGDAMVIRNHVINMLEQADVEHEDANLRKALMTFVVVGGGFSGVETVGALNDFVRESIKHYYHNLVEDDTRIILVNAGARILPEVTENLAEFSLQKMRENGVEVMLNTRLEGATANTVKLNDGSSIPCHTLVWAGGGKPDNLVLELAAEHDRNGRLLTNCYLEVQGYENVFSLGDCACIIDSNTQKPFPPTAQHALRQGKVAASNVVITIKGTRNPKKQKEKQIFAYKTKGVMALIGKRNGVGILFGHTVHGFMGWFIWRFYYLSSLPTIQKRLRVMVDWFIDLFFKRDVTRLKNPYEEKYLKKKPTQFE